MFKQIRFSFYVRNITLISLCFATWNFFAPHFVTARWHVYNVMSTEAERNGDIPTLWLIIRDLSTSVEMTQWFNIVISPLRSLKRSGTEKSRPLKCHSERVGTTKRRIPWWETCKNVVMQCFATWDPSTTACYTCLHSVKARWHVK